VPKFYYVCLAPNPKKISPMKHIVVPIDFSDESMNGLRLAILFANKFKSKVQLVYVQNISSEMGRVSIEDERKKVNQAFKKIIDEYSSKLHDSAALSYIVKKGKVYREVVNQAQAYENSMIICSTHGASGFEEFFIGSNAFKIISASEFPVITIRHGSVVREINTIVMPIDTSNDTRQKVPYTAEVAKAFGAEVHVLGVTSSNVEEVESKVAAYCKQACDFLKEQGVTHRLESKVGSNVTVSTIEYALDVKADLISIMTEQNDSLADFVLGSFAQQMLNKSPIPVLSISPKEIFIMGTFRSVGARY
jgi:nucleotide-binding universal stress UspA family protein